MSKESEASENLSGVAGQTEELLRDIAKSSAEKSLAWKETMGRKLQVAAERLRDFEETTVRNTRQAARATNDYVHENPWRTAGIAVAAGFLLALLFRRQK